MEVPSDAVSCVILNYGESGGFGDVLQLRCDVADAVARLRFGDGGV